MPGPGNIDTSLRERFAVERELAELRSGFPRSLVQLVRAARSDKPIVVGPFLSEVGFECLYWVPMLRWFVRRFRVEPERITAVSRGGPVSWYAGVASRYVEAFDHVTPAELREIQSGRVAETKNEKQLTVSPAERRLLAAAGVDDGVEVIHPAVMYRMFWAAWAGRRPIRRILDHTRFEPFGRDETARAREVLASLPQDYVAVKPYFSRCFADTERNRTFLSELLGRLSASTSLVLLATDIELDHHGDYRDDGGRLTELSPFMEARDNLEIQSAVIRGARALYTTYGGFAHLAPFLGTRALCFYSDDSFNPVHRDVMFRAVRSLRERSPAGFVLANVADFTLLDRVAGPAMEGAGA